MAVGGHAQQIDVAVGLGLIKALVEGLTFPGDAPLICKIIAGLRKVLKMEAEIENGERGYFALLVENEGYDKLDVLQEHENAEVCKMAFQFLDTFFKDDSNEHE